MAEIKQMRRELERKKKMRTVRRIAIVVILISLAVIIFINKDFFSSDSISSFLQGSLNKENDEEGFPVSLPSGEIIAVSNTSNNIVVTNQTNIYFYSQRGRQLRSIQHQRKKIQTKTAGDSVLCYSVGEEKISIENSSKTVFEKTLENPVVTAELSKSGKFVISTESDVYTSEMRAYDKNGNAVFKWIPSGAVISSVAISPDGNFVAAATLYTSGGKLMSGIYLFSTSKSEALVSYQLEDEMVLSLVCDKNSVTAVTDHKAIKLSRDGEVKGEFSFGEKKILDHQYDDGMYIFAFQDVNDPGKSVLTALNDELSVKSEASVNAHVLDLAVGGKKVYLLSETTLMRYEISTAIKDGQAALAVDGVKVCATSTGVYVVNADAELVAPKIK